MNSSIGYIKKILNGLGIRTRTLFRKRWRRTYSIHKAIAKKWDKLGEEHQGDIAKSIVGKTRTKRDLI